MCGIVNKGGTLDGNQEVDYWLQQNSLCAYMYTVSIGQEPIGSEGGDTGTQGHLCSVVLVNQNYN